MKKKTQYTLILTIVSLLASIGVSSTFLLTRDIIKKREEALRTQALYTVLPGLKNQPVEITPPNTKAQDRIYKGLDDEGRLIGYAASGEAQGYSSKIKVIVGIAPNLKKLLGIDIIAQKETPGLGTKMVEKESNITLWNVILNLFKKLTKEEEKKNLPLFKMDVNEKKKEKRPWFQEQFESKTYNQLVVSKVKDNEKITAITGATISTKAAINAVKNAITKIRLAIEKQKWEIKQ